MIFGQRLHSSLVVIFNVWSFDFTRIVNEKNWKERQNKIVVWSNVIISFLYEASFNNSMYFVETLYIVFCIERGSSLRLAVGTVQECMCVCVQGVTISPGVRGHLTLQTVPQGNGSNPTAGRFFFFMFYYAKKSLKSSQKYLNVWKSKMKRKKHLLTVLLPVLMHFDSLAKKKWFLSLSVEVKGFGQKQREMSNLLLWVIIHELEFQVWSDYDSPVFDNLLHYIWRTGQFMFAR